MCLDIDIHNELGTLCLLISLINYIKRKMTIELRLFQVKT